MVAPTTADIKKESSPESGPQQLPKRPLLKRLHQQTGERMRTLLTDVSPDEVTETGIQEKLCGPRLGRTRRPNGVVGKASTEGAVAGTSNAAEKMDHARGGQEEHKLAAGKGSVVGRGATDESGCGLTEKYDSDKMRACLEDPETSPR